MKSFTIRRAIAGEESDLSSLAGELFRQGYGTTHPEPELSRYIARKFAPDAFRQDLQDRTVTIIVLDTGTDGLAGYAVLRESHADRIEIVRFYVDERLHGSGAAQSLMTACVDDARQRGMRILWLQAWQQAGRALAFYRKMGFVIEGTTTFEFGDRIDNDFLLMRTVDAPTDPSSTQQ